MNYKFILGYPVLERKMEFKNNLYANVEDWNKYLMASRVIIVVKGNLFK